jgi:hypothetical protein
MAQPLQPDVPPRLTLRDAINNYIDHVRGTETTQQVINKLAKTLNMVSTEKNVNWPAIIGAAMHGQGLAKGSIHAEFWNFKGAGRATPTLVRFLLAQAPELLQPKPVEASAHRPARKKRAAPNREPRTDGST